MRTSEQTSHTKAELRDRGQLTLPAAARRALRVQPGDDIEFVVHEDQTVTVRGLRSIPTDQAWFWSSTWQAGEGEATDDIAAGRTTTAGDVETFLASMG